MNKAISLLVVGTLAFGSGAIEAASSSQSKQPVFKPLAGADKVKRGQSLKPVGSEPELPPIITQTRLQVREDGSIEQVCEVDVDHSGHDHAATEAPTHNKEVH